jgi:hypothetical protein
VSVEDRLAASVPVVSVEVSPVRNLWGMRHLVALPFRLHAGTPWIPRVKLERYAFLNRRLNAYFTHGQAEYFLARRGGHVVGRISAQVDRAFNEFHRTRCGMFGFLEFEDDPTVPAALLDAAAVWLRQRDCERMVGPMDFQMNDESGILIDGFEREPMIKQPWHPPYYQPRCEAAGLRKAIDLLMYERYVFDPEQVEPQLKRIADRALDRYDIRIRPMSRRHLRASWMSSPPSTTPLGRGTGDLSPTRRQTSTPTRLNCSWSTTPTGS